MSRQQTSVVLQHIRKVLAVRENEHLSDRELLECFARTGDDTAFATLVRRHGPMVLNVCQRILHNWHDAEDACQAAFLVLARRAGARHWRESVGPWLYRVAYRLALRVQSDVKKHRRLRACGPESSALDPLAAASGRELCMALDGELSLLPTRLQAPLVLCCLEGFSRDEAAQRLGCSLDMLKRRLEKGRSLLRQRLLRRGFPLSAVLTAVIWNEKAAKASLPIVLAQRTIRAAGQIALGRAAAVLPETTRALAWADGLLRGLWLARCKGFAALVVALCLAGTGLALAMKRTETEGPAQETAAVDEPKARIAGNVKPEEGRTAVDRHGDPLPPEVLTRLGTLRFRSADCFTTLNYTSGGHSIVSAGWHGPRVWDVATGRMIRQIQVPSVGLGGCLSADGSTVAVGGFGGGGGNGDNVKDNMAGVYALADSRLLFRFGKNSDNATPICFSPDGKILAVSQPCVMSIDLYDVATGTRPHSLKHEGTLSSSYNPLTGVFTPDGKTLISGAPKGIHFWDAKSGREAKQFVKVSGGVYRLVLSPDGRQLAYSAWVTVADGQGGQSSYGDDRVHVLDLASGKELRVIGVPKPGKSVEPVAAFFLYSPDGRTLLTSTGGQLLAWDWATGSDVRRVWDHGAPQYFACSPDGKTLAAVDGDKTLRLCDLATGRDLLEFDGHRGTVNAVAISPNGRQIATAGDDRMIYLWDRATGQVLYRLAGHTGSLLDVTYSADGTRLFSSGYDLRIWNTQTGQELRQSEVRKVFYSPLVQSPDGKILAIKGEDKKIYLLDAVTGRKLRSFAQPTEYLSTLGFSSNGQTLRAWGDQRLHFWETATGAYRSLACPVDSDDANVKAAFSPDDRMAALATFNYISLVNMETGKEIRRITGWHRYSPNDRINCLRFSPDSKTLALGCMNSPVIGLAEVATGKIRHELKGHDGEIDSLAFTDMGKVLVSGAGDTSALVWDLTGRSRTKNDRIWKPGELDSFWADLTGSNAVRAYDAIRDLAVAPAQAVPYIQKHLSPAGPVDSNRIAQLVADLDSPRFAARQKATTELEKLGDRAEAACGKALAERHSLEARHRLEGLLDKLRHPSPTRLRSLRALEVLELIDDPSAHALLLSLAHGAPDAPLTREASASLSRLDRAAAGK